ncbi:cadmium-exporting ATPase [Firmicutes bacterium CAG:791]|nr:cadmium-exporting ATPase [Firmicutes bacterium CAG:791]
MSREEKRALQEEDEEDEGEEEEEDEMEPKQKLIQIIAASILLIAAVLVTKVFPELAMWQKLLIFLIPYAAAGFDVLKEAMEHIGEGEVFDEDFLMCIATIGALLIGFVPGGKEQFAEAVFVMLFFQVGELFEGIAEGNSERAISQLLDIRPDTANVERGGEVLAVSPEEVAVGETVVIRPGEKVPMDGVVLEGTSSLDTVALTGESVPRDVTAGDPILSGCVNQSGVLRVRVEKEFGESTAAKILDLVQHAGSKKSRSEKFISRFAGIYTPIVVFAAIALALIPPMLTGDFAGSFAAWLLRALTFLIVSCPCALVVSVPLAFFGGIGAASKAGILIKGSSYMDALAKADTVVFDKTGTLTKGVFEVTTLHPEKMDEKELLHLAAHVERYSTHPIAVSLRTAFGNEADGCAVESVEEVAGQGIRAVVNGRTVCVGNSKMMDAIGAKWKSCDEAGTIIHVAVDGVYAGHIHISDIEKPDAKKAIAELKTLGVGHTVMLTGDREEVAKRVASDLGLDEYHAELLPADKVSGVEQLLQNRKEGASLVFVGDGINDAPVLARADIGVAMGAMGSDAAIEAADVVLMDDQPSKIAKAVRISRSTLAIAKQNIVFAIAVKVGILILAAFGLAPMWLAVFGDTGVLILCVLNSMRALKAR